MYSSLTLQLWWSCCRRRPSWPALFFLLEICHTPAQALAFSARGWPSRSLCLSLGHQKLMHLAVCRWWSSWMRLVFHLSNQHQPTMQSSSALPIAFLSVLKHFNLRNRVTRLRASLATKGTERSSDPTTAPVRPFVCVPTVDVIEGPKPVSAIVTTIVITKAPRNSRDTAAAGRTEDGTGSFPYGLSISRHRHAPRPRRSAGLFSPVVSTDAN